MKFGNAAWSRFPSYVLEPDPVEEDDVEAMPSEHDLVLRYAIIGIFLILATAALSLTKVIALPVAAGIVFGLVLGPAVDWLVRRHVPQLLAAGLVVVCFLTLILAALVVLAVPVAAVSDQAPAMMSALQTKLGPLFHAVEQAKRTLSGLLGGGISVSQGDPLVSIAMTSSTAAGGLLIFVATVYFWLATRRHLKARALRLCLGRGARRSAGSFFQEIEARAARYFGLVTLINLGMGLCTTAVAAAFGLPFPIFWGALAFLLNYLAFVGPIIVTVAIFASALIDAPTVWLAAAPAGCYFMLHLIEGNVVTPLFVGRSLTISPFLVFIGFIFWLWLWGPIGAVLSTPLLLIATVAQEEFARYRRAQADERGEAPAADIVAEAESVKVTIKPHAA